MKSKNFLIIHVLAFLAVTGFTSCSNDDDLNIDLLSVYTPGKTWIWKEYIPGTEEYEPKYSTITVSGDTVVKNTNAIKVGTSAIYEDKGISYIHNSATDHFEPLMNFNVKKGTEFDYFYVAEVKDVLIQGIKRRVITLQHANSAWYWIEGIGSTNDMYITPHSMPIGHIKELIKCYDGETLIFDREKDLKGL